MIGETHTLQKQRLSGQPEDVFTVCQVIAHCLEAEGWRLELPAGILKYVSLADRSFSSGLSASLPPDDEHRLLQSQQPVFSSGFILAQEGGQVYWAGLPFLLEQGGTGYLLLFSSRPFEASQFQKSAPSQQVLLSTAIEYVLSQQLIWQFRSNMEALHTVSLRMAAAQDLQDILNLLVESTLELLPADAAYIYLRRPAPRAEQPYTFGAAACRDHPGQSMLESGLPGGLLEWIASRNWPLIVDRIEDEKTKNLLDKIDCQVKSLAGYPLIRGGRLLGIFIAAFKRQHTFSPEDRSLLSLLTDHAVIAIDNSHVAHRFAAHLGEMNAIYRIAQKMGANMELKDMLQSILAILSDLYRSSAVAVMLPKGNNQLQLAAVVGDEHNLPDGREVWLGEGLCGRAAASGEIIYLPDLLQEPSSSIQDAAIRSLCILPLVFQGGLVGTLSIDSCQPHAFDENDREALVVAAAQIANATENARLYQQEHLRAEELDTVINLSRFITQHLDIGDILGAAHHAVEGLMPCEAFVIAVNDRRTSEAVVIYVIDKGIRYLPQTRAGATGMTGYVLSTGKPLLIQDLSFQPVPFELLHFGSDESVRSIISAPLKIGDEVLGMVSTQSYQPNAFSNHDLDLLITIANHIAIAVENYNLYADLEDRYNALQEADRSRLELIQNVTHELLTPLTFIKGYVELMTDGGLGAVNEEQRQGLLIVDSKVRALERLVDDLATLEFGGGNWLLIQDIDLVKIARSSIYLARQATTRKDISITLESDDPFPLVQADPDRISQVIDNLLSNALKFVYPDSIITVQMQAEQEMVKIAVFNPGDAIAVADQVRLFQRFFQIDRHSKGRGLGLAIVKHIVEAHGGRVWVESQEGVGNTFTFTIPISQKNILEKDSQPGYSQ
ncbi:MAG: GAF domain-containing protein [Anaerolineales bacterium]|nr:GAF domain-containing protein [Anaerolineales bacterium]